MYRHGALELLWPKLQSPLDSAVVAQAAGGLCCVYGFLTLFSYWLNGRTINGMVLAGFFCIAGSGVAARGRQALVAVHIFLLTSAALCMIAFGPSFVSFCSIPAAVPLTGGKAIASEGTQQRTRVLARRFLPAATLSALAVVAFGTVLFSYTTKSDDFSMLPTISPREALLCVGRPLAGAVSRGDLWEVNIFGERGVARVIGIPGDDIQIRVGKLILNGVPTDEAYAQTYTDSAGDFPLSDDAYTHFLRGYHEHAYGGAMTVRTVYRVPYGHYFVLNDNRKELWDSRALGPVSRDQLVARFLLAWKFPRFMNP